MQWLFMTWPWPCNENIFTRVQRVKPVSSGYPLSTDVFDHLRAGNEIPWESGNLPATCVCVYIRRMRVGYPSEEKNDATRIRTGTHLIHHRRYTHNTEDRHANHYTRQAHINQRSKELIMHRKCRLCWVIRLLLCEIGICSTERDI